jgi:hypothetical protein
MSFLRILTRFSWRPQLLTRVSSLPGRSAFRAHLSLPTGHILEEWLTIS